MFESFAETLEPRGEGGFIGWRCALIFSPARVSGHGPNPRSRGNTELFAALKAARTILAASYPVKNWANITK
jgi:hypothetical protein